MWKPIANERLTRCSKASFISLLLNNLLDDTSIWTYANTIIEIERIINSLRDEHDRSGLESSAGTKLLRDQCF
jgi:hypothetical protein